MSPHKRKCDVLGFIGTTLLLLTIVTCSSIGTAMPTFGQKQTSKSFGSKESNCLMYSRIMDILNCSTVHFTSSTFQSILKFTKLFGVDYAIYKLKFEKEKYDYDQDKLNELVFPRNNEDIDVKYRYLEATHILFMRQRRIWTLSGRNRDERVMFYARRLPHLSCNWINYRKIKETYLFDPGHNNVFNGIIVQRRLVQLLNNKHQEQKHTGEYILYINGNLLRNQYQCNDPHFLVFVNNHKQLGDLTIIRNGGMDLYTYPVYYSLYDHMTTDWNIIERSRECSNYKHLIESAENCLRSSLSNDPVSYDSNRYKWEKHKDTGEYVLYRHELPQFLRLRYLRIYGNQYNKHFVVFSYFHKSAFHVEYLKEYRYIGEYALYRHENLPYLRLGYQHIDWNQFNIHFGVFSDLHKSAFHVEYLQEHKNTGEYVLYRHELPQFLRLAYLRLYWSQCYIHFGVFSDLHKSAFHVEYLQEHKHTGEYVLYRHELPQFLRLAYLRIYWSQYNMHFGVFSDLHKSAFHVKYLKKIEFEDIRFLTETQHPQYLRRTRVNAVFSYPNQCLNIDRTQHSLYFRLLSAFHRDAFFAEYLENFYRKETHKLKYQVTTHMKMTNAEFLTTAYSEMLIRFTQSEPNIHSKNGGDRILRDHLDSITGIDATVLLILLLLSNLSIRIVNQEECIKAGSSHSQILKVAAKERKQNFPTENQEKGVRLCEMCVNQNSTVAHCKTCKLYICAACSILHERVWALMNHTLCPFKEI